MKDLPAALRPREKLLAFGPAALGDTELLALLLRTGLPGKGVLEWSHELMTRFGGLAGLLGTDSVALKGVKGLGPAKRAELQAVLELARRAMRADLVSEPVFDSPDKVRDFLRLHLGHLDHEVFGVMFLDIGHRLLAYEPMFRGSVSQASVYPREVARRSLALNASAVILAHNHPSGRCEPSTADEVLTRRLIDALALVDVRVLDHLIVGGRQVTSFAERGLL
ncbi:RadC family protein [Sphaerotilus mobilis]|uniref:DNA replication and repair protein RadC n=1 Tax=Sphaerotilus mobilis TaxID=47994 RepID=A0A4Q7LDC9_9BURK|nr:DNA repair protein RadC [Sphaerotilus mobilis]RZS51992.1 DNA replication and repair protein RadC [Sphaerotilus mobilis]